MTKYIMHINLIEHNYGSGQHLLSTCYLLDIVSKAVQGFLFNKHNENVFEK